MTVTESISIISSIEAATKTFWDSTKSNPELLKKLSKNVTELGDKFYYFGLTNDTCIYFGSGATWKKEQKNINFFFTIASDLVVKSPDAKAIIMIIRGVGNGNNYGNQLALPGGFFDAVHDFKGYDSSKLYELAQINDISFNNMATREFQEEVTGKLSSKSEPVALQKNSLSFIGVALNEHRDQRWKLTPGYTPTMSIAFVAKASNKHPVAGADDAAYAGWKSLDSLKTTVTKTNSAITRPILQNIRTMVADYFTKHYDTPLKASHGDSTYSVPDHIWKTWFDEMTLEDTAFDHDEIINKATAYRI